MGEKLLSLKIDIKTYVHCDGYTDEHRKLCVTFRKVTTMFVVCFAVNLRLCLIFVLLLLIN